MKNIVIISGGFDPLHSGHISFINEAKSLGDMLVVAVNSNLWLERKKGKFFLDIQERINILSNMKAVDEVITFDDSDGTAIGAIKEIMIKYPNDNIIFANGGDRSSNNIPEMILGDDRLSFKFGIGGEDKKNSSSKILSEWKNPKTERSWGYYRVLHSDGPETKVKELIVSPNKKLSLQRHANRSEHWHISSGNATIKIGHALNSIQEYILHQHQQIHIPVGYWHQLINNTEEELRLIEIQYGTLCIEEDIERLEESNLTHWTGDW